MQRLREKESESDCFQLGVPEYNALLFVIPTHSEQQQQEIVTKQLMLLLSLFFPFSVLRLTTIILPILLIHQSHADQTYDAFCGKSH